MFNNLDWSRRKKGRSDDLEGLNESGRRITRGKETLTTVEALGREIKALRERSSRLSTVGLRIYASLDPETVLHEVPESARALPRQRRPLPMLYVPP